MKSLNITIKGIVQGVGFRPFVYNLAREMDLKGFVTNTSEGVVIAAEGNDLDIFVERLKGEAPPLAKIMSIEVSPGENTGFPDFAIRESTETGSFTLVSPDISICDDCLKELFDKDDRRYLYPFINCTNCGPRYTITRSVPYDRVNTTMQHFRMCGECEAEYHDPSNRRFHAQPNACEKCGPRVSLLGPESRDDGDDPVQKAIGMLKDGKIVAVKGLGGFHIACDAENEEAVRRLRERKRKNNKPFALMAPDIESIRRFCHVSEEEEALLVSQKRPIVLLTKKRDISMPDAVAPNNSYIGFMLPYTPLHYLLFGYHVEEGCERRHFTALVMTSGNITEEPIVTDNREAAAKLSGIADAFLVHDREIFMRVDDSVVRIAEGVLRKAEHTNYISWSEPTPAPLPRGDFEIRNPGAEISFIRRSRGYVPDPIRLSDDGPDVLGCGADLKNTFTLTKGRYAIPSQHIGDMENFETLGFFEETLKNLKSVYRSEPVAIAHDLHPGYLSAQWAMRQEGPKKCAIQHHYAHVASVMAEKGIKGKVIGVSFDGTGFGEDGALWGGEFLIADIDGFKRAGHIEYIPLPGGESAIREPWRTALSWLNKIAGEEALEYAERAGFTGRYGRGEIENILKICGNRAFSPLSSGAGRLFDAVSALTGVCDRNTFEGEAAIALEALTLDGIDDDYPVDIIFKDPMEIDFSMTILSILKDMERKVDRRVIATKFHNTVSSSILNVVLKLSQINNIRKVVLSGGVFQNFYLMNRVINGLLPEGLVVAVNELVPSNDAGISLGQAYILRERLKGGWT